MTANKLRSLPIAFFLLLMFRTNSARGEDQKASPAESDKDTGTLSGAMEAVEYSTRHSRQGPPAIEGMANQTISTLGLEEYKPSLSIDLKASQARLFRLKDRIRRTAISDSKIAEPVVVSDSEFEILAKKPGVVILALWDDAEHVSVLQLRVMKASEAPESIAATKSESNSPIDTAASDKVAAVPIPPITCENIALEECKKSKTIDLRVSESQLFKMKNRIVRTALSNSDVAKVVIAAENGVYLIGKAPGTASVFVWDDKDAMVGIDLRVSRDSKAGVSKSSQLSKSSKPPLPSTTAREVETWTATKSVMQKASPRLPGAGG